MTNPSAGVPAQRRHPLRRLFLLDVLRDRESRPALTWAAVTLLFGMVVYSLLEGWSLLDSLYFSVISLATVGYGDLTPTTSLSKAFTIFYVLNGIGVLLSLFDRIRVVRASARES
ncbi:MAG: two pore domain potassium channel family protein [Actinomycetales bacterium]|nr:two pore domain potassium channel family protein [Actinomycetales bacterium]